MCRPRRFDLTSRETNWAETRSNSLFKPHRKPEKYHKRVFNNRVVQLPVFMQQISSSYYFRETEINWSDSPFCSPRAVWPQSTWGRGRLRTAAKHQTCKGDTKTFKAGGEDTAEVSNPPQIKHGVSMKLNSHMFTSDTAPNLHSTPQNFI